MRLAISLLALLGYGGWALYSNWMDGSPDAVHTAWRAAALQGGYSALLTWVNMRILEAVYHPLAARLSRSVAVPAAAALVTALQYLVIVPLHLWNNTPEILQTLLPGLVISSLFALSYLSVLSRPR